MNQAESADLFGQLLASLRLVVRLVMLLNQLTQTVLDISPINSRCSAVL